jgi:hypothetical protein
VLPNIRQSVPKNPNVNLASYATAVVSITVGIGAAVTLVFHPTLLAEIITVGGFGVGIASGILLTLRQRLPAAETLPTESENPGEHLKRELTRFRYTEGTEEDGTRALSQLKQLNERCESYERLLREKLNPHELTFQRYFAAVEDARQLFEDQLNHIAMILRHLAALQAEGIEQRLSQLPVMGGSEKEKVEATALRDLLTTRDEEREKLQSLFALNESLLTEVGKIVQAVSQMKDLDAAGVELESVLKELRELAQRASKYR